MPVIAFAVLAFFCRDARAAEPVVLNLGGSRIGVTHQRHIVELDKSLGNLRSTMLALMGFDDLPSDFMGGEWDGVVKPLVLFPNGKYQSSYLDNLTIYK